MKLGATCFLFLILITSGNRVMAADNDFVLSAKKGSRGLELVVRPKSGFHINAKAPNVIESLKPRRSFRAASAAEDHAAYNLPNGGDYLVSVYICDAGNTYCVKREASLHLNADASFNVASREPGARADGVALGFGTVAVPVGVAAGPPDVERGFFMNDLAFAVARAKAEKKNVLVDFSAIWCPACLKLERDVLDSPEFSVQSKPFVKLRIDLDWQGSRTLRDRYQIRDVPTVLVLDNVGEELGRIHGYRPKDLFLAELAMLTKAGLTPLAELKARAIVGDKVAADRAGLMAYDSLDFEAAVLLWKDTETQKQRRLAAEINLLSDDDASHAAGEGALGERRVRLLNALEAINKNYPDSIDRLEWLSLLAETERKLDNTEKANAAANELLAFSQKLLNAPALVEKSLSIDSARDDAQYTLGEVWSFCARAERSLGRTSEEKAAWSRAIEETKRGIHDPSDKGRQLLLVRFLSEAGREAEIDSVLEALQTRFPTEYTFYYKRASRFLKSGHWADAEKLARAAVSHAYGTNRIDCSIVLAKAQKALGKVTEARATAAQALGLFDAGSAFQPDRATKTRMEELRAI